MGDTVAIQELVTISGTTTHNGLFHHVQPQDDWRACDEETMAIVTVHTPSIEACGDARVWFYLLTVDDKFDVDPETLWGPPLCPASIIQMVELLPSDHQTRTWIKLLVSLPSSPYKSPMERWLFWHLVFVQAGGPLGDYAIDFEITATMKRPGPRRRRASAAAAGLQDGYVLGQQAHPAGAPESGWLELIEYSSGGTLELLAPTVDSHRKGIALPHPELGSSAPPDSVWVTRDPPGTSFSNLVHTELAW